MSSRFEDDLNTLEIDDFVTVDLTLSRQIHRSFGVFAGVSNLFDDHHIVRRATNGLTWIGAPRLVHFGVRFDYR